MHMTSTDLVSLKTAIRHMAARLESESIAASQWASIARNRGVLEVAVRLEETSVALKNAYVNASWAAERLFEVQEKEASESHHHE